MVLDSESNVHAAQQLARKDRHLRSILKRLGPPPLWKRPATLGTLVRIILEQQVSLASAKSTFDRFVRACEGKVSGQAIIKLGDQGLRELGFSRQKARYTIALAKEVSAKRFRIGSLRHLDDHDARARITSQLGMGDWTADVFLMMSLLRSDIFPTGDLALVKGMRELDGGEYPDAEALIERADAWRPYRSVACRMIWQNYLHDRNQTIP